MSEGTRVKVKSKDDIGKANLGNDFSPGNRLKIPAHIQAELDKKGLVPRFVSLKKMSESGGYHPMGWTPYTVENPQVNPITGTAEKVFRVGDLVLAVKPKAEYQKHKEWLAQKSKSQSQMHRNNVKEMRDRIKDSRADKHVSLIEGYEENGDDEE